MKVTPAQAAVGARWLAVGRTVLGLSALVAPGLLGRTWVGADAEHTGTKVLARAMGGRDVVLGLGTLTAMGEQENDDTLVSASRWIAFGGVADLADLAATLLSWRRLPRVNRWLVAGLAGGSAIASLVMAGKLLEADLEEADAEEYPAA
ncbi:hypothetical protein [Fodinicola feengrottensis]|uniref:DUF4267 domain-containing protein n=1 Tax=Fodinicola feengrottensis TaxID=435914 RepID=A0ABN2IA07_9ACTN|nr:hypothetical protein [Fodinicola feengrottensis]